MSQRKVAVIGGGASGLMAAITASQNGAKVDIWERNERVGKKILATGNGKCNFANMDLNINHFRGENLDVVRKVLDAFDVTRTKQFFESQGMMCRSKDTLLYPYSEQAATVLDALRFAVADAKIHVLTEELVTDIKIMDDGRFQVSSKNTNRVYDRVVLTCGGYAAPKTGSDGKGYLLARSLGHRVTKTCPALTGLKVKEKDFKSIAGVRCAAKVSLLIDGKEEMTEKGELQLTDYGISGIVVFQLSRFAGMGLLEGKKVTAKIDVCPDIDIQSLAFLLQKKKHQYSERDVDAYLSGLINKKLGMYLAKKASIFTNQTVNQVPDANVQSFARLLKSWEVEIVETNSYEQAQVTAGGISFDLLDETLQSKLHKGLYFAGEILDVDGKCGGYNLQWAWSSGYIAGLSAAQN